MLNSLYGMSLTGSKETPRFILLLSQMMQYILYDCNTEKVSLAQEIDFLKGYFEIEQKKFPDAEISLVVMDDLPGLTIPPLLFLPLVENCFKHGRHKLENNAGVRAEISFRNPSLSFRIENEVLPYSGNKTDERGGIGLKNIKQRLELYYPQKHKLLITKEEGKYLVTLTINIT